MYFAHLSEDKLRSQTVLEHLRGTAKLAGEFAEEFNCKDWGCGCGLMHDIGKYSDKFQKRLNGGSITDHATAGAAELFRRKNYIGAYCISGVNKKRSSICDAVIFPSRVGTYSAISRM